MQAQPGYAPADAEAAGKAFIEKYLPAAVVAMVMLTGAITAYRSE